jgi:hypothetical protein
VIGGRGDRHRPTEMMRDAEPHATDSSSVPARSDETTLVRENNKLESAADVEFGE